jgi:hypothetical protein
MQAHVLAPASANHACLPAASAVGGEPEMLSDLPALAGGSFYLVEAHAGAVRLLVGGSTMGLCWLRRHRWGQDTQ